MGKQAAGPRPAGGPRGRQSPWRTTLLAAAILSSCFLPTQAQEIPVRTEPSQPLEGKDVTLTPGGEPDFLVCVWYRGEETEPSRIFTYSLINGLRNGPNFTERETRGPNCSLHIMPLMLNDTGNYVVTKIAASGGSEKGRAHIQVLEKVSRVTFTSRPDKAIESQPFVLDCSSAGSNVSYVWSKGDQILESGGHITVVSKTLTFDPVSRSDTGNYTCSGHNSFSSSNATYLLDVFYGPDDPVISPPRHDYAESAPLRLSCHADSKPPAQYAWSFNETELNETSSQLSIPSLLFNDTGNYTCNASNPETGVFNSTTWEIRVLEKLFPPLLRPEEFFVKEHTNITLNCNTTQRSSVTVSWFKDGKPVPAKAVPSEQNRTLTVPDISKDDEGLYTCEAVNLANSARSNPSKVAVDSPAPAPPNTGLSPGAIVGIVIGCLLGVVLIVAVLYVAIKGTALGRMPPHSSNGNIPSAPGHNQGATDAKPAAGEEDIQYTTLAFNSNRPPQPSPGTTNPLESGTIYSVIKKK